MTENGTMRIRKSISIAATALLLGGVTAGSVAYADDGNSVTVNGQTDPGRANELLQVFNQIHSQNAGDTSFTPTDNPTLGWSGWTDATGDGSFIANCGGETTTDTLTIGHESTFSWSVGGSVTVGLEVGLPSEASLEIRATFGVEHDWSHSEEDYQTLTAAAGDGEMVWVVTAQRQATVTGNYTFKTSGGSYQVNDPSGKQTTINLDAGTYTIQNVTVSILAAANGSDDPNTGVVYMVRQAEYNGCDQAQAKVSGHGGSAKTSGVFKNAALVNRLTAQVPKLTGK